MTPTKRCPACKKDLPRTTGPNGHWTVNRARGDGLEGQCKACKRAANGRTRDKSRAKHAHPELPTPVADPLAFDIDVDEPTPPPPAPRPPTVAQVVEASRDRRVAAELR